MQLSGKWEKGRMLFCLPRFLPAVLILTVHHTLLCWCCTGFGRQGGQCQSSVCVSTVDGKLGALCAALQVVLHGLAATLPSSGLLHAYVQVFLSWRLPCD